MAKKTPIILSQNLITSILATWNDIGSDLWACCEESGERINNEGALESCIDAGRMATSRGVAGKAADDEIGALIKLHTYSAVMRELKKQIRLVR